MEREKRRRILIVAGIIVASVVLLTLGMWLGSCFTKQPTQPKPEPTKQEQIEKKSVEKAKQKVVKPAPVVATALAPAPTPAPPSQATSWLIITGQPQTFINGWGDQWLIDPNGNFQCPRVDRPTSWTGGQEVWVYHLAHPERGWYTVWAPACYR